MGRMHEAEVGVTEPMVRRLLAAQFPQWAYLPLRRVAESGTDHALFRLGDHLVARLPRIGWADGQSALEAEWLPRLADQLPLAVSIPVALGKPDDVYPFSWSVNPWLPGHQLDPAAVNPTQLAVDLAEFVRALQGCDPTGATRFGSRGHPLDHAERDRSTRAALAAAADLVDAPAALTVWELAQAAPPWSGPPAWFHGDLIEGNLLMRDGRLSAILDWGTFGVGDPACELAAAWDLLDRRSRAVFRKIVDCDDATWERGRAWAVSLGAIGIPYYRDTVPAFAERGVRMIEAVLSDP
ncbi:MAG: aminoglycoside phosphotransferase family protein [Actinomycetota bacterium]|nr:aminoglycoside phosphotransferase family protein [Actinomycetota bacterium]